MVELIPATCIKVYACLKFEAVVIFHRTARTPAAGTPL